ncbi:NUDIX domain-containing protein [Niameybacter massiliensis]|uniref:NUDIX domain-containing protein n=1 Tax=Holtiella tumoricola TaxID=3018743 RepID=A0AA42J291_9FIRM|nr:NUDIX domain-containing protein [Holtiella tumoricola]
MEKWDLYNEQRQPLNRTHNRPEPMVRGEYHIVVSIWTVNSKHEVLTTLRHPEKDKYPNFWENTAGSVLAGETSRQGARRELLEETGIKVEEEELHFLRTIKEESAFVDLYIIRKDIGIDELVMQEGETVDAKWVSLEELDEMIEKELIASPVAKRLQPIREDVERFIFNK